MEVYKEAGETQNMEGASSRKYEQREDLDGLEPIHEMEQLEQDASQIFAIQFVSR